jgi:hypothetical protein
MKKLFLFILLTGFICAAIGQGKYAGPVLKKIIGKTYKDESAINALKGYKSLGGSLITDVNDPESLTVSVFKKGTTAVVLFSSLSDSAEREVTVLDVIEVKNIQKGWEIKTGLCSQGQNENAEIVALVRSGRQEILRSVKQAWRCKSGRKAC